MRSGGVGSPALGIRLPCRIPLTILARAPGYLSLLVAVYPGVLLVSGTVALPALGAYIKSLESRFLAYIPLGGRIWKPRAYYVAKRRQFDSVI